MGFDETELRTEKQASIIQRLANERGVTVDTDDFTKADAKHEIDKLRAMENPVRAHSHSHQLRSKHGNMGSERAQDDNPKDKPSSKFSEPMTEQQRRFIAVMAKEAGEPIPHKGELDKGDAGRRIQELIECML